MISRRDITLTTDIIRSFKGSQFTMEEMKSQMAFYPPKVRVPARTMANIIKQHKLAAVVGNICPGGLGSTTLWRPLV